MHFVYDLDGTLCFDGKTIEENIVNALIKMQSLGHTITFASARPIRDLEPVIPISLKDCNLVGGNGGFVRLNGKISVENLDKELVHKIVEIIEDEKLTYLADGKWNYSFTGDTSHPIYKNISKTDAKNVRLQDLGDVCKFVIFKPTEKTLKSLFKLPIALTHYKNEFAIDISPLYINKVAGLKKLHIEEFIAFGNDVNDQCMFEKAIYSVCVGSHEVKQFASLSIPKEEVANTILELASKYIKVHL